MTTASNDDLQHTLANLRRQKLDEIFRKLPIRVLPPGNADGIPPAYTARPTGKKGHEE